MNGFMNRVIRSKPNGKGFALLELIFALFIVTAGMFGVIQMYLLGLDKTKALSEYTLAMEAVQNEMETLRAMPPGSLVPVSKGEFMTRPRALDDLMNAQGTVSIEKVKGTPGLKEISVRLVWTGEKGRRIEKGLTTLVATVEGEVL